MRVIIAVLTQRASQSVIALPLLLWQFHDGLGFLTNHGVLSNTFEASLQTVNPKLTLPYWDFTIETSSAGASGDTSAYQSQTKTPIFQESWFGSVDHTDDMVSMLLLPKASERGSLKCMCGFMFLRERPTYRTDGRRPRLRPLAKYRQFTGCGREIKSGVCVPTNDGPALGAHLLVRFVYTRLQIRPGFPKYVPYVRLPPTSGEGRPLGLHRDPEDEKEQPWRCRAGRVQQAPGTMERQRPSVSTEHGTSMRRGGAFFTPG